MEYPTNLTVLTDAISGKSRDFQSQLASVLICFARLPAADIMARPWRPMKVPSDRSDPSPRRQILLLTPPTMSHTHNTTALSSNFQLIFNDALNIYKKRTKKDLLAHPLAAQLQACDSPTAVLAVLQLQVQPVDRSQSSNDRWTRWLDPTVNVLYAFSETLGEGVSLVYLGP